MPTRPRARHANRSPAIDAERDRGHTSRDRAAGRWIAYGILLNAYSARFHTCWTWTPDIAAGLLYFSSSVVTDVIFRFLIGSDLIRECTGVEMKADNFRLVVDSVRAVVRNQFCDQAADFLLIVSFGSRAAILELSALATMRKNRPFALKTLIPLGLAPNCLNLLPSGRT
jgi:hypothetical protein